MTPTKALEVHLLGPAVWGAFHQQALADLSVAEQRYALSMLQLAHSRHVGISIELIAALVPHLLGRTTRFESSNPWSACFERLHTELVRHRPSRTAGVDHGFVLQRNPSWVVLKLMLPLAQRAIREMKRCYLFCEEALQSLCSAAEYTAYAQEMAALISELPKRDDEHALFWEERALTLASLAKGHHLNPMQAHPDHDPLDMALLLRVTPDLPADRRSSQKLRQLPSRHRPQKMRRTREGGFDGIHLTRRPEDLDSILLSEFTNPDFLLTDRLLNTGFFALERTPRREKLKDVGIVALMPEALASAPTGAFAKACLFDCLARLAHRLRQSDLNGSAFFLLQGDRQGQLCRARFPLQQLPSFAQIQDREADATWRRELATALSVVPHLLDPQNPTCFAHETQGANRTELDLHWMISAWKHYCTRSQSGDPNAPARFSYLHLMLFLPIDAAVHPLPPNGHLLNRFGMSGQTGRYLSVLRVPTRFSARNLWSLSNLSQGERPLQHSDAVSEKAVAKALVGAWMEQFTKEIWRA